MCIRDRLGAFTLLLADTLGRTIAAPYEISAAIIMSVVGGPFFILLLRRSKQSYGPVSYTHLDVYKRQE